MKSLYTTFLLVLLPAITVIAQDSIAVKPLSAYPADQLKKDEYGKLYYYDEANKAKIYEIDGETVVIMDELTLAAKPKFNNQLDQNYYWFLNKKLNRVYPLFLTALQQYRDITAEMAALPGDSKRTYIRQKQSLLADQYEKQLRDLTTTEGRVFAKLMHRATGKTVYDIIHELRGGWSAFWWNVKGNIADIDLKEPYDPHANRSDLFLESLLKSNWNIGYLKPYPGASEYRSPR